MIHADEARKIAIRNNPADIEIASIEAQIKAAAKAGRRSYSAIHLKPAVRRALAAAGYTLRDGTSSPASDPRDQHLTQIEW